MPDFNIQSAENVTVVLETPTPVVFEVDGTLRGRQGDVGPQGPVGPAGPPAAWGNITGTLSDQSDLQSALNSKYDASNPSGFTSNLGTVTSVGTGTGLTGGPITSSGSISLSGAAISSLALADSSVQPGDNISVLTNNAGYTNNTGTVTSVGISIPTGLTVSNSPVTTSGTIAIGLDSGYVIPTIAALAAKLENITGLVTAGTNVSITGSGTSVSPYVISSSGGGGGGGTPGGVDTNLQFNDGGSFGGFASYEKTTDFIGLHGARPEPAPLTMLTDSLFEGGFINTTYFTSGAYLNFSVAPLNFAAGTWVKTGGTTAVAMAAMAPDQTSAAYQVSATVTPGTGLTATMTNAAARVSGWQYSSFYARTLSGTGTAKLNIRSTTDAGTTKTISADTVWRRYFVAHNFSDANNRLCDLTDLSADLLVYGHQMAFGEFPTVFTPRTNNAMVYGNELNGPLYQNGNTTMNGSVSITNGISLSGNFVSSRNSLANSVFPSIYVYNNTLATVAVPVQVSPAILQRGFVWDTGVSPSPASRQIDWQSYVQPTSGNPGTSKLTWQTQYNAAGFSDKMMLSDTGQLELVNATANVRTMISDRDVMFSRASDGLFNAGIRHDLTQNMAYWGSQHNFLGAGGTGTALSISGNQLNGVQSILNVSNSALTIRTDDASGGSNGIIINRTNRTAQGNNAINVWQWNGVEQARMTTSGRLGIKVGTPTALIHLAAGTATAGTAPLKLSTGTALATLEDGALEYHSSHLYFTIGSTRYQLDQQGGGGGGTVTDASVVSANGFAGSVATSTTTPAITISTTVTGMLKGNGTAISAATAGTDYLTPGAAQTVTATRVTKRAGTVASNATPTINSDTTDTFTVTALATNITSFTTNLTGTPTFGQQLLIGIKDNGTTRTVAHGASFVSSGIATPITNTVPGKQHFELFVWDGTSWVCMAADPVGY